MPSGIFKKSTKMPFATKSCGKWIPKWLAIGTEIQYDSANKEGYQMTVEIAARQYRVLMDHPGIYLELWFGGNPSFCFSLSEGLYYQQYLFNVQTGTIEETFIL